MGYNRLGYNAANPVKPVLPSSVGFTGINPQSTAGAGIVSACNKERSMGQPAVIDPATTYLIKSLRFVAIF